MGVSHLAIANMHDDLQVVAVCDNQGLVLSGLRSQIAVPTFKRFTQMLDEAELDCLFIATPTRSHYELGVVAMERGIHLFVEKPLTLSAARSAELAAIARRNRLANQVGYHNRFVGTFREAARLVSSGAIGEVHHVDGRAFGPVVTRQAGAGLTWRSSKAEGGGCLHDYACHVADLMNFVAGRPEAVVGATLSQVHSTEVEDTVHALFRYPNGATGTLEANWSDPSHRKMTTTVAVYGSKGKIHADRQECRVFLSDGHSAQGYEPGWTVRYITDLQEQVRYYLRGEEYSAQVDAFARAAAAGDPGGESSFATAADADWVVEQIALAHRDGPRVAMRPAAGDQDRRSAWRAWAAQAPIPPRLAAAGRALRRALGRKER
jgi:predicted dehydrogenase